MIPRLLSEYSTDALGYVLRDTIKCEIREERNGAYDLELTYPVGGSEYSRIAPEMFIRARVDDEGHEDFFRIYSVTGQSSGTLTVRANHICYDLSGNVITGLSLSGVTASSALISVLNGTGFTSTTDITGTRDFEVVVPLSVKSMLGGVEGSVLDMFGGEYYFYRKEVNLLQARGADNGVVIEYGKNITSLSTEKSGESTYNGLVPYAIYYNDSGDEVCVVGDTIDDTSNSPITNHTKLLVRDFSSDFEGQTVTKAQVDSAAASWITSNRKMFRSFSETNNVSFVPLWYAKYQANGLNYTEEKVKLCDIVTVNHSPLGVSYKAKVVETRYDCLTERYTLITVGDPIRNFAQMYADDSENVESTMSAVTRYPQRWAKDIASATSSLASLASPAFTGNPTAPTQAASSNNTRIATTAFVKNAISGIGTRVNGNTSAVTLSTGTTAADLGSFTLSEGTWLIIITGRFNANGTGERMVRLSASSTGSAVDYSFTTLEAAAPTGRTYIHAMGTIKLTTEKTYYIVAYQTSGGDLSTTGRYDCIRIL